MYDDKSSNQLKVLLVSGLLLVGCNENKDNSVTKELSMPSATQMNKPTTNNQVLTPCIETGAYACKTGQTEPLYKYQWHLQASKSFFASYSQVANSEVDLNIEELHALGYKGQGINVIVLDDGIDIAHQGNRKISLYFNQIGFLHENHRANLPV